MRTVFSIRHRLISGLLLFTILLKGQVPSTQINRQMVPSDSAALKSLVVKLLKWHGRDFNEDFPLKDPVKPDSVYSAINWGKHQARKAQLKATNLFTDQFLNQYDSVALFLDKELRKNKVKYVAGYLPPYDHANEWCDCQDYPSNPWRSLVIKDLKTDGKTAAFSWSWAKGQRYRVQARKNGGVWRIEWLEKLTVANFKW